MERRNREPPIVVPNKGRYDPSKRVIASSLKMKPPLPDLSSPFVKNGLQAKIYRYKINHWEEKSSCDSVVTEFDGDIKNRAKVESGLKPSEITSNIMPTLKKFNDTNNRRIFALQTSTQTTRICYNIGESEDGKKKKDTIKEENFYPDGLAKSIEFARNKLTTKTSENEFILMPFSYSPCIFKNPDNTAHAACLIITQTETMVFDTGVNNRMIQKLNVLKSITGLEEKNINFCNKETIQAKNGCGFNIVNFVNLACHCIDTDDLKKQITSGEMQFKVMAETSKQMQSRTGNIQIIENLGESVGEGANVIIMPETENPEYMEFNLGNSRFKMSLSQNDSITNNKYISRPGLIKSIGDRNVLEAIQQKQDKLPNNPRKAVNDRLQQLQPTVQQQTMNIQNNGLSSLRGVSALSISGNPRTAPRTTLQGQRPQQGRSILRPH